MRWLHMRQATLECKKFRTEESIPSGRKLTSTFTVNANENAIQYRTSVMKNLTKFIPEVNEKL